jgi:hypothetical protein
VDGWGRGNSDAQGSQDLTPVTLTDVDGKVLINPINKTEIVHPASYPPTFFQERARETLDCIASSATAENPGGAVGLIVADLSKFRQNGPWDMQRLNGGKFDERFVDYATVAIGMYGSTVGNPLDWNLTIQNAYASLRSTYKNETFDLIYTSLPLRNVENTRIGYDYVSRARRR